MSNVEVGAKIPSFESHATNDTLVNPELLAGKNVVIYFYPKDNTPGCTTEGQDFRDNSEAFTQANTVIFGVSRDSLKVHGNFKNKHEFPFELISDPEETLCKLFDVIKLKKLYGKEYMGIVRSTFVIDETGKVSKIYDKVRVKGHAEDVLNSL